MTSTPRCERAFIVGRTVDSTRPVSTQLGLPACLPACPARDSWPYQLICRYTFHSCREGAATHPRTLPAVRSAGNGKGGFRKVDVRFCFISARSSECDSPASLAILSRDYEGYRMSLLNPNTQFGILFLSFCSTVRRAKANSTRSRTSRRETYDNDAITIDHFRPI